MEIRCPDCKHVLEEVIDGMSCPSCGAEWDFPVIVPSSCIIIERCIIDNLPEDLDGITSDVRSGMEDKC